MLVLEVMVISRLKNIQWNFYGIHGMSQWESEEEEEEEERTLSVQWDTANPFTTGSNLPDTNYEIYEFNDDLRDTIK